MRGATINGRTVGKPIFPLTREAKPWEDVEWVEEALPAWVDIDRAVDAIERDQGLVLGSLCDSRHKVCGHPGRCAVGALLFYAGVTNKRLKEIGSSPERGDAESDLLLARYGFNYNDMQAIMNDNDSFMDKGEDPYTGLLIDEAGVAHAKLRAAHIVKRIRRLFRSRDIRRKTMPRAGQFA